MRPEDLQVNLRPRSSWEAMELGTALLRRHAGAVWRPWLLAMLAGFVLVNAVAWALGQLWLAGLLLWWLKPAFERIVLYVLSRAVFGRAPPAAEALRAQWRFGTAMLPAYLTWRRLGPARALLMPVDLLEGNAPAQRRARRSALAGPAYSHGIMLTTVCVHFELALMLACVAAVFLFIPAEQLATTLHASWGLLRQAPPAWMALAANTAGWLAAVVVGPFYVAAGFGLYLNRRSESEAWDVELAFRRLRERLLAHTAPLLLALAAGLTLLVPVPASAQHGHDDAAHGNGRVRKNSAAAAPTLPAVFGTELQDDARFRDAATRAYQDPLIGARRTVVSWQPKGVRGDTVRPPLQLPKSLQQMVAMVARAAEWALWLLLVVLLLVVVGTAPRWLPWLRGGGLRRRRPAPPEADSHALAEPETLPDDVPAAVRKLWAQGNPRAALALLYRASVEAMAGRVQATLPPGATEAQCLRIARRLPDGQSRELFARTVRVWQYTAYAGRLPDAPEFEALLLQAQEHWGWRA
ncbi:DUF4129 domain-containing protein [Pseudoxanthomonas koreensis]|uniref:DUF4129 domain-containing protein n=1 Tax=Pseudoxanthomonas koreensis TaxID=266061 RepID=UPI0035A71F90